MLVNIAAAIPDRVARNAKESKVSKEKGGGGDGDDGAWLLVDVVDETFESFGSSAKGVDAASSLSRENNRRADTDQAVVNRVKRKPPRMTTATFNNSMVDPKLGAKGKITKLGTKKTGNHLANVAAPGERYP
mmetsp:Transcript_8395/g.11973  ORF Transcript_8395/g.11973 Transcript_8395/m.11973 type:complete len:132 (+) Transcript_8395:373-768(+)